MNLKFYVMGGDSALLGKNQAIQEVHYYGGFPEFIAQFIDLGEGYDSPIVESSPCPRSFRLYVGPDAELEGGEDFASVDSCGELFRYIYADQFRKVELPERTSPFDFAMMGYFMALAEYAPATAVVLYTS